MAEKGKYLYCVIKERNPRKFNILGQEEKKLYTVNEGDLAVAVSDTPIKEFSFIREHLMCHQRVIEEVMKKGYDVLPVQFGTVAKSAEDIKEKILKAKRKELLETFKKIEGKIELGVKAFWQDMPTIFKEILDENKKIQIAKKEAKKNPNPFKVAAVGELVQKALLYKREREAEEILNPLKEISAEIKEKETLGDSMVLNSAFLIAKRDEKKFDKKIEILSKEYDKRIKFQYIGPVPPYNFIKFSIIYANY